MPRTQRIFCLDALAPEASVDMVTGLLALEASFGWEEQPLPEGGTLFRVQCDNESFIKALARRLEEAVPGGRCQLSSAAAQDWLAAWRQFFTPVTCGRRFVVLPPWLADTADFPGRTPIIIEPKSAFGTGHHATTALCLGVLSDLLDQGRLRAGQRFLDLGTGSGILGIACCKCGLSGEGYDIDPLAVDNARENRLGNHVPDFSVHPGGLEATAGRRYDLVVANILARPLMEMAPELTQRLAGNGCLVLSGVLAIQAADVAAAYTSQGLPAPRRILDGEWCALVWA